MKIMKVVGLADGRMTPVDGTYLVQMDVDARAGRGMVETSLDRTKARQFDSAAAALEYWRRPSTVTPTRPDGKPNRPLTAYTVEVEEA